MIDPEGKADATGYDAPSAHGALFADDFQSGLGKWKHTSVPLYQGRFVVGQGASPIFPGDRALIIPQKARHYAISAAFDGLDDMSDKDFALQYEVKLDDGMTCGGAYVKLPTVGFPGSEGFDNNVKYSVMFGPDKCGSTEKVHFIFQSLNPVSKEYVEHHLTSPPALATTYDKNHHLYGLYVYKNGTFAVSIDNVVKREGSLLEEFDPPLQPLQEIEDPEEVKPGDWVDEKKIPDPKAKKPDDWDEDAPKEIEDEDAEKPKDWLDDEPEKIPDPKAAKPDTWNDEEDGEWTAPLVANPKCKEVSGCGAWKRPMKANPNYKGKWNAPMIDNPAYIGPWKPRKIANPSYYAVTKAQLLPIKAVGLEIWTMDQGVLIDDVYIGTDVKAAKDYAEASFGAKKTVADKKDKAEKAKADKESKKLGKSTRTKVAIEKFEKAIDWLEGKLSVVEELLVRAGAEPALDKLLDLGVGRPVLVVVAVPTILVALILVCLAGGKKAPQAAREEAHPKKTDAPTKDDEVAPDTSKEVATDITESGTSSATRETDTSTLKQRAAAKGE